MKLGFLRTWHNLYATLEFPLTEWKIGDDGELLEDLGSAQLEFAKLVVEHVHREIQLFIAFGSGSTGNVLGLLPYRIFLYIFRPQNYTITFTYNTKPCRHNFWKWNRIAAIAPKSRFGSQLNRIRLSLVQSLGHWSQAIEYVGCDSSSVCLQQWIRRRRSEGKPEYREVGPPTRSISNQIGINLKQLPSQHG